MEPEKILDKLSGAIEGITPIQNLAPVPNDVDWVYIALFIILGTFAVSMNFSKILRWLINEETIGKIWMLVGACVLVSVCSLIGAIVGWRV